MYRTAKRNPLIFSIWTRMIVLFFLTSSLRHKKILIKEFSYSLMSCHQHGLCINFLVQRHLDLYRGDCLCKFQNEVQ